MVSNFKKSYSLLIKIINVIISCNQLIANKSQVHEVSNNKRKLIIQSDEEDQLES